MHRLVSTYKPHDVVHQYGTGKLTVHLVDPLGKGWYDHEWPDLHEIAWLRRRAFRPGGIVFDIGAHQGVVAMMIAREVRPDGKVIAVEANAHNATVARRNHQLNGCDDIVVIDAAIADHDGELTFNEGLNGQVDQGDGAWGQVKVRAVRIDTLTEQYGRPDVLFIDVEGFELLALRGGEETLKHRPHAFVEVHVGCGLEKFGGTVAAVFDYFPSEFYEWFGRPDDATDFVPIQPGHPLTADRFFLLALRRDPIANS